MIRPKKLKPEEVAKRSGELNGWALSDDGLSIERALKFKDFVTAWTFMCRVAAEAERLDHHPDWSNVYNRVSISLTTHDQGGLSDLDFQLAQKVDEFASA